MENIWTKCALGGVFIGTGLKVTKGPPLISFENKSAPASKTPKKNF